MFACSVSMPKPGCLFGSVGVNLNPVASGLRSFEQTRKSHAISYARIERGENSRWEGEAISQALGFRDGQLGENPNFAFPCGLILASR